MVRRTASLLTALVAMIPAARAEFIPFTFPTGPYLRSTAVLPVGAAAEFTDVSSLTDGVQTVTFSTPVNIRDIGSGWSTWNSPPYVESSTPRVLRSGGGPPAILTLSLSVPSKTVGFELEPNTFNGRKVEITFRSGSTPVGAIALTIAGDHGALVGGVSTEIPITDVDIIVTDTSFAIAQIRYGASYIDPLSYLVSYAANLPVGDSYVNITNTGSRNAVDPAGTLCANVYVFDPSEELVACCSCMVTPDGLRSLSAKQDLVSKTLTPSAPSGIVIKLLASQPVAGTCDAASPATLEGGLRAWSATLHQNTTTSGYTLTEGAFRNAILSASEYQKLTTFCGFIKATGSTFGICNACRVGGGLGGATH